jgi:hypothetical protein
MQVAAAGEVEVADPVVVVVAVAEDVEERQVYTITDTVTVPVTMVAIMANPVEKKRSPTEMVPLAGTSVADSAAEGHRRSRTMTTKTEAALRFLFAICRGLSHGINK